MPESVKDGRYSLLGLLGQGTQGQTYDAVDLREGRPVAVKRFDIRTAKTWKEAELAERETRTLQALSHPKLPRYLDHFEEGGSLYLVMEKIEGETLASLRKRGVVFTREDVERLFRDASDILGYLHGRVPPVIHRDLKPNNVIRRPDGSFAFVDFGAVRDKLRPEGGSTIVGTFGYMAPEQFQGRALPASDVYAIGATALSMLTGREPEDLPHRGLALDVRAALGPSADDRLVESLERMLDPDPDRRAQKPAMAEPRGSGGSPPERGSTGVWWQDALREGFEQQAREYERRAREYEARAVRGVPGADGWGRGAEGWRRAADKWRAAAERHAEKTERRAARHAKRFARKAQRHAERIASSQGRRRHAPPWPILLLFVAVFTVGAVGVTLATQVVVPTLLRLLSVFFARDGLTRAADAVRDAGQEALENIQRSQQWFMSQMHPHAERPDGWRAHDESIGAMREGADAATNLRVDEDAPRVRVPATEDDVAAEDEVEEQARRTGR
jgi:tRNA A-37 threonylcarbamoyl transferase component Bud32